MPGNVAGRTDPSGDGAVGNAYRGVVLQIKADSVPIANCLSSETGKPPRAGAQVSHRSGRLRSLLVGGGRPAVCDQRLYDGDLGMRPLSLASVGPGGFRDAPPVFGKRGRADVGRAGTIRPWTIFYYYQPQEIILGKPWPHLLPALAMLYGVGAAGYVVAWLVFTRRDLPAPL